MSFTNAYRTPVYKCMFVRVCVYALVIVRVFVCIVFLFLYVCVRAYVLACVLAFIRARVRAYVCKCVDFVYAKKNGFRTDFCSMVLISFTLLRSVWLNEKGYQVFK